MDIHTQSEMAGSLSSRRREFYVGIATTVVILLWSLFSANEILSVISVLLGLTAFYYVAYCFLYGHMDPVLLTWACISPFGYYYLVYPQHHSIITFDRVVFILLFMTIVLHENKTTSILPTQARRAGLGWALFCLFAGIAAARSWNVLYAYRVWSDGFVLPSFLGWYILTRFEAKRYSSALHPLLCVMITAVAAIALTEAVTFQDIMPLGDTGLEVYGVVNAGFARVNGPFGFSQTVGMVGAYIFLLLLYLRHSIHGIWPSWRKVLHGMGLLAAAVCVILPFSRTLLVVCIMAFLMDAWITKSRKKYIYFFLIVIGCITIFMLLNMIFPYATETRTSLVNLWSRFAQWTQDMQLILQHPFFGVGLINSYNTLAQFTTVEFLGINSVDSPHNDFFSILVETGMLGFVPFMYAQYHLWRAVKEFWDPIAVPLHFRYLLFMLIIQWGHGMTFDTIYYGEINVWFVFVFCVIYRLATQRETKNHQEVLHG